MKSNFSAFAEVEEPVMVLGYDEEKRVREVREMDGAAVAVEVGLYRNEEEELVVAAELDEAERMYLLGEVL